jgi:hypothetical protein
MTHARRNTPVTLSHKHEAVMVHMLQYPDQKISEVAAKFGLTQQYLSIIANSDNWKARFAELQEEHFSAIMQPLAAKLEALAHVAVEKWSDCVAVSADPEYIKSSADKVLQRLGFGATSNRGQVNVAVNVTNHATPDALERANAARARLREINRRIYSDVEEGQYSEIETQRHTLSGPSEASDAHGEGAGV